MDSEGKEGASLVEAEKQSEVERLVQGIEFVRERLNKAGDPVGAECFSKRYLDPLLSRLEQNLQQETRLLAEQGKSLADLTPVERESFRKKVMQSPKRPEQYPDYRGSDGKKLNYYSVDFGFDQKSGQPVVNMEAGAFRPVALPNRGTMQQKAYDMNLFLGSLGSMQDGKLLTLEDVSRRREPLTQEELRTKGVKVISADHSGFKVETAHPGVVARVQTNLSNAQHHLSIQLK